MLQWKLTSSKDSIQDVLTCIQRAIPSMILVSRLKKSVYFNPPEPLHNQCIEAEDSQFERIPVLRSPRTIQRVRRNSAIENSLTPRPQRPQRFYSDDNVSSQARITIIICTAFYSYNIYPAARYTSDNDIRSLAPHR